MVSCRLQSHPAWLSFACCGGSLVMPPSLGSMSCMGYHTHHNHTRKQPSVPSTHVPVAIVLFCLSCSTFEGLTRAF